MASTMKNIPIVLLLSLLLSAVLTKPSKEDLVYKTRETLLQDMQAQVKQVSGNPLSGMVSAGITGIIGAPALDALLGQASFGNYFLFSSLYVEKNLLTEEKTIAYGAFGMVFLQVDAKSL